MMGLALGSWLAARHKHKFNNLLSLYGFLELGIALSAVVFLALMKVYPAVYIPLAGMAHGSVLDLTVIRIVFSTVAMIMPAALIGATIPVLTGNVSADLKSVPGKLSFFIRLQHVRGSCRRGNNWLFSSKDIPGEHGHAVCGRSPMSRSVLPVLLSKGRPVFHL